MADCRAASTVFVGAFSARHRFICAHFAVCMRAVQEPRLVRIPFLSNAFTRIYEYRSTYMYFFGWPAEPSTEILGGPDVYIDKGSTINLTCVISYSPEPPAYILWNHNDAVSHFYSRVNASIFQLGCERKVHLVRRSTIDDRVGRASRRRRFARFFFCFSFSKTRTERANLREIITRLLDYSCARSTSRFPL